MMMPSVAELTYFYEVSNTLNLSQAAKNLTMSQPALSRAIQHMESIVGTTLLIRHAKGVKLTAAGEHLLLQIRPMLQNWQDTRSQVLAFHNQVQGKVKIGCPSTIGLFMHDILNDLLVNYEALDLELKHAPSDHVCHAVIDLSIDIGIVANPVYYPELIVRKIGGSDFSLWVADSDESSNDSVLICDPDLHYTQLLLQQCKAASLPFKRILKVNSQEVIANLTANGCGMGVLTSCFIYSLYANKLKRVLNAPVIPYDLFLIYRREYRHVVAIKAVIDAVKQWVEKQRSYQFTGSVNGYVECK